MNEQKKSLWVAFFMLVLMALPITGVATTILNPDPTLWNEDNGAEIFIPSSVAFSIELADPFSGEFGFYRGGDSATLIAIFDSLDASGDTATIDFINDGVTGFVFDNEQAVAQSTFTAGLGDIGFYLTLGANTLFSEASLNPLGSDWFASFQSKADPATYLIGFEAPLPSTGALGTVALETVTGVSAVPVPAAVWLFGSGLIGLIGIARRKKA